MPSTRKVLGVAAALAWAAAGAAEPGAYVVFAGDELAYGRDTWLHDLFTAAGFEVWRSTSGSAT